MRKIVHISDIHFGTADLGIARAAVKKINALSPDVVVCSGDLTQRAKSVEFKAAREFLDALPTPQIVIPGNHDVPLWNVFDRFFRPLNKYKKFISSDLSPEHIDEEVAIVGVNTARSSTIKGGRINEEQIAEIRGKLCALDNDILKIVVTHHPFDLPEGADEDDIVGRADKAMPLIAQCGGDVFLAGHLHVSNIETTSKRYRLDDGHLALIIQAGTATSVRVRGEVNSFNLIEWERPRLRVERLEYDDAKAGFFEAANKNYSRGPNGCEKLGE
ncbi:MAG: metallophosphoesterase [Blastocatellia bacterium]|nr:metallophosphoesterase [Blastocatellia bacterium]